MSKAAPLISLEEAERSVRMAVKMGSHADSTKMGVDLLRRGVS